MQSYGSRSIATFSPSRCCIPVVVTPPLRTTRASFVRQASSLVLLTRSTAFDSIAQATQFRDEAMTLRAKVESHLKFFRRVGA